MYMTRFTKGIVLACMGALAACSSSGGSVGVTELNVVVPTNAGTPSAIDIQEVEYLISCDGNSDTFLDNNQSFADEVLISGDLEVVDGRTSGSPPVPTEVWQGFMDLPPGPCVIQLAAVDNDGERICVVDHSFTVTADTTTKVDLVLLCDISFQAPVGSLDVDATFSFVVGNFCPDLFVLNCLDSEPAAVPFPPLPFDIAASECQVRFRDGDSTCGTRCDPQSCDTAVPPVCTPGPDPGVSTTITCTGGQVDCDGNPTTTETECTFSGDQLTTGTWFAGCIPPALGGTPGAVVTCTAVTTDGDIDCDKTKVVSITCPGLNFCDEPSTDCNDSNDCTADSCDPIASACVNANEPAGTSCAPTAGGPGECDGAGACVPTGCFADIDCDDGNECTVDTCDLGTNTCNPPANEVDGTSCDSDNGTCQAGTCVDNCAGVVCDDGNECTDDPACVSLGGATCPPPVNNDGNACTTCTSGTCACDAGACIDDICVPAPFSGTAQTACRNSFNQALSAFPVDLDISTDVCVTGGAAFNATVDPTLNLDTTFLQAAATTLCALGITLTNADVNAVQATIDAVAGATCTPQTSVGAPPPFNVVLDVTVTGVCGGGGTVTVNSGIAVPLPQVVLACTADAGPGNASFCATGDVLPNVLGADPVVDTYVVVFVSPFAVNFDCEDAVLSAASPCTSNADCTAVGNTTGSTGEVSTCDLTAGTCVPVPIALDPNVDCPNTPIL